MTITMDDASIKTIAQLKEFLKGMGEMTFQGVSMEESYAWVSETLCRFNYFTCTKKDKTVIKTYLIKMIGRSESQITRLITQQRETGDVKPKTSKRHCYEKKYTATDVARLAETDMAHGRLSGPATRCIFKRMYNVFGDKRYERLKDIWETGGQVVNRGVFLIFFITKCHDSRPDPSLTPVRLKSRKRA